MDPMFGCVNPMCGVCQSPNSVFQYDDLSMWIIGEETDFSIFQNKHISEMESKELNKNNIDMNDVIMKEEIVVPPIDDPNVAIKLLTNYTATSRFWQTLDELDGHFKLFANQLFLDFLYGKFNFKTTEEATMGCRLVHHVSKCLANMLESICPPEPCKELLLATMRSCQMFMKSYYLQKVYASRLPSYIQFMTYQIPATGEYFYYVSVKEILINHLLKDENVIRLIENETPETATKYIRDNNLVNHVRIILYGYDFSLGGQRSSECHKLCAIYMDIENSPHHSGTWNTIPLVMLFPREKVNEQLTNLNVFLQPLIDELKELKNGLQLRNGKTFNVSLAYCTGDDLFTNEILGLKGQFSNDFICRYCRATHNEIVNRCGQIVKVLEHKKNDLNMHRPQLSDGEYRRLVDDFTNHGKQNEFGIERVSIFHQLGVNIFQIAPLDLFQDFCEGILVMVTENILANLEDETYATILKNRSLFSGQLKIHRSKSRVKTTNLKKTTVTITGKGASKFELFIRLVERLPKELFEKIESASEDNPAWIQDYITLRKIVYMTFSNGPFSQEEITTIADLTNKMDKSLARFGTLRKPKIHFLTHLADMIEYYGSLNPFSTARFEHKHRNFKHLVEVSKNYIDCPKSIIWYHQLHQCVHAEMEKLEEWEKLTPKPPLSAIVLREIKNIPGQYVEAKSFHFDPDLKQYTVKGVLWKADFGRVEIIGKIRQISTDFSINDDQLSPHICYKFVHNRIAYVNHAIKT